MTPVATAPVSTDADTSRERAAAEMNRTAATISSSTPAAGTTASRISRMRSSRAALSGALRPRR